MRAPLLKPIPGRLMATTFLLASLTAPTLAYAADKPKAAASADDISAPARGTPTSGSGISAGKASGAAGGAASVGTSKDALLWDHWYTVTVGKTGHYEYYNDRVETKKGRIVFQNRAWKMEEGYINEEQLGVFATADTSLTPLFFNFHGTYRATETNIDGNVKEVGNHRELTVRVRKGSVEQPLINVQVPPKAFFSALFPVWLATRLPSFKVGETHSFQAVLEDSLEARYAPVNGQVRIQAPDELAKKSGTTKINVNYSNADTTWWVDSNGSPLRIEMPIQKAVVERVAKETALKFLPKSK